jgi:dephospho-CoA kinase
MGKSTAAAILRRWHWPIYDADAEVHKLLVAGGAAVPKIAAAFPDVVGPKGVDRAALGRQVFGNAQALRRLEGIIHPMMGAVRRRLFMKAALNRRSAVVLDVPLLFETVVERTLDIFVVVTAPAFLQRQRAIARPGMTDERFRSILARQTPDAVKRQLGELIVPSGLGKREALRRLLPLRKLPRRHSSCP